MGNFKGFDENTFLLLELNKFNDSKDFYESVKEEIKEKAILPVRAIASDLADDLFKIDPKMNLNPTKMVSRIRRDTRFSKNKDLYRANVWCMFMRDKKEWNYQPCMWFEFFPESYSYGVGMFRSDAKYLDEFRAQLLKRSDEFAKAIKSTKKAGAVPSLECFKREKEGSEKISEDLRAYYNAKYFYFIHSSDCMTDMIDASVFEKLKAAIKAYTPMYKFLVSVTEKLYETQGGNGTDE